MKKGIHPEYYQAKVVCACGNTWTVGSTKKEIQLDLCSACHPFFTGTQKIVDTAGRVEKFRRKYGIKDKTAEAMKKK
ncbi:MAG TPA: 50S ribosomal protein L31 [candidate division Zixibacteria bacterium]|nr:50S ribosomal protein L31 [candidate division Zixibacteria bacterium]